MKEIPSTQARYIYGVLDVLFALLYAYLILVLIPSRSALITIIGIVFSIIVFAGGIGIWKWKEWGLKVAFWASWIHLSLFILLLILLVSSIAYLHGIYGGIGQAGVALGSVAVALSFELIGLLPALKLLYIYRMKKEARVSE